MPRIALRFAVVFTFLFFATQLVAQPPDPDPGSSSVWAITSPTLGADLNADMPIAASGKIKTGATGGSLATYRRHAPSTAKPEYYPEGYWERVSETGISIDDDDWSATVALLNGQPWPIGEGEMLLRVVPTGSTNAPETLPLSNNVLDGGDGAQVVVDIVEPPEE